VGEGVATIGVWRTTDVICCASPLPRGQDGHVAVTEPGRALIDAVRETVAAAAADQRNAVADPGDAHVLARALGHRPFAHQLRTGDAV
jgi:hypothetical protein